MSTSKQPELFNTIAKSADEKPESENLLYFPEDLLETLNLEYTKPALATGYYPLVRKFLMDNEVFCRGQRISHRTYDLLYKKSLNKDQLARIAAVPFLTKELFLAFRKTLAEDVKTLLDELVWNASMDEKQIRKTLKIEIVKPSNKTWRSRDDYLHNRFRIFSISLDYCYYPRKYQATLFLTDTLRKIIIEYYDKPKDFYLNPLKSIRKTDFVFSGEPLIGSELPRILIYYSQGNLKLLGSGRPVLSSLNKMKKALRITEFYSPDVTPLSAIRTHLLANLIVVRKKWKNIKEPLLFLKEIFKEYTNGFRSHYGLLNNLKGISYVHESSQNAVEQTFWSLLLELPVGEWVSIDNIVKFANYRMLTATAVDRYGAGRYLYYNVKRGHYTEKVYIGDSLFDKAIKWPTIKGTFFLFAAFGLVDVAYNTPNTSELGTTYYSSFDGLSYVRLNKLGAHLCGKDSGTYEFPHAQHATPISLSPDTLVITADETDQGIDAILQDYAQKIGVNRYQVTYQSLMKECRTPNDLKSKIHLFKETISDTIPPLWDSFFQELLGKINPFLPVKPHKVLKLPDDRELINVIAQDNVLKNLVIKAEDFHIIVLKSNLSKFKARLREFGYFLDQ